MANSKFTLKRNNGSTFDELYPKTTTAQVDGLSTELDNKVNTSAVGAANGVASLDANSKIPLAQLPNGVFDNLAFISTINEYGTSANFANYLEDARENIGGDTPTRNMVGLYFVIGSGFTIPVTFPTGVQSEVYTDNYWTWTFSNSDSGLATTDSGALEAGDWIVIEKVTGLGTSVSPFALTFGVVNNTYENATTAIDGIVKLSDGNTGIITGLTGSTVITEGNLIGMVYTAGTDLNGLTGANADKLAKTDHTHSNYQPIDNDLTTIAGLNTGNGNFIVGNGTTWVAESGATARTSLGLGDLATLNTVNDGTWSGTDLAVGNGGTGASSASDARTNLGLTIGQDVQAYSANLATIAGLTVNDGNIIVGNGTTWVAESGATARTSLDVYSTSEVDDFFTNRPTIFYNTTTGSALGSLIIADVVAV